MRDFSKCDDKEILPLFQIVQGKKKSSRTLPSPGIATKRTPEMSTGGYRSIELAFVHESWCLNSRQNQRGFFGTYPAKFHMQPGGAAEGFTLSSYACQQL
jgi:hypothetical protein